MATNTNFGRCTICTLPFDFDDITSLKCGHTYHHECISKWVENAKNCPKCRTKNTLKDITRLFIDETDTSFLQYAVPPTNAELEDMKLKMKKNEIKMKEMIDNFIALESSHSEKERTNKKLKRQLEETNKKLEQSSQRKDQHIKHLETILEDQTILKHKLEEKTRRLKTSEFYALISRKVDGDDIKIQQEIDKYTTKNGDPSIGEFLQMYRKQSKQYQQTIKQLSQQLERERKEKNICEKENQSLKEQVDELKAELLEARKRRAQTNAQSPESSLQRRPRPSLGFSFIEEQDFVKDSSPDDSIEILSSGPMPRPIPCSNSSVTAFDFFDNQPMKEFPIRKQPIKKMGFVKMPYLSDDLAELLSPNLHAHANSGNIIG